MIIKEFNKKTTTITPIMIMIMNTNRIIMRIKCNYYKVG